MTRLAGEGHRPRGVLRGSPPPPPPGPPTRIIRDGSPRPIPAERRLVPIEYFARWLVRERGGDWGRLGEEARDYYLNEARQILAEWERDGVILCQRAASVDRAIPQEVD